MDASPSPTPPSNTRELTVRVVILGILLSIVMGAANVYVGLKAGMTVAATFPAAVVAMAVLRLFKGNILEENLARTTGSVGEALAAGAIFTVPAFIIVGAWDNVDVGSANWFMATALLAVGGVLGVLRCVSFYGWISVRHIPFAAVLTAGACALVLGVIVSALAAVYPARVAARLAPMEAMRVE